MSTCRTGYHFAEAYVAAAREQQGSQPIPSRMPTENEVSSLLNTFVFALRKLEEVRDMVQQNRIQTERARDNGGRSPEDEDVSMYGDGIKPPYAMHEVKKRRGVGFFSFLFFFFFSFQSILVAQTTHKMLTLPSIARGSSRAVPQL
jgi:hypothetical protein